MQRQFSRTLLLVLTCCLLAITLPLVMAASTTELRVGKFDELKLNESYSSERWRAAKSCDLDGFILAYMQRAKDLPRDNTYRERRADLLHEARRYPAMMAEWIKNFNDTLQSDLTKIIDGQLDVVVDQRGILFLSPKQTNIPDLTAFFPQKRGMSYEVFRSTGTPKLRPENLGYIELPTIFRSQFKTTEADIRQDLHEIRPDFEQYGADFDDFYKLMIESRSQLFYRDTLLPFPRNRVLFNERLDRVQKAVATVARKMHLALVIDLNSVAIGRDLIVRNGRDISTEVLAQLKNTLTPSHRLVK